MSDAEVFKVGDQVRIRRSWDTGIVLAEESGKFRIRCDCGMQWRYTAADIEPLRPVGEENSQP